MTKLTPEERLSLTRSLMETLQSWGASAKDQVILLGLPADTRGRSLRCYHEDTPLPDDPVVNEHVYHLVGITQALHTTYPTNQHMAKRWMNNPHRRFARGTPLSVMLTRGLSGIKSVRAELDCTYAWDQSGSSHKGHE